MANEEHLKILKQGIEAWNQWRKRNPEITPDLTEATLYKADLSGANLNEADLTGAGLAGANLYKAELSGAGLSEADLSVADLSVADLNGAKLSEADLNGAQDLTAKQLITTINWQEAILNSSLRVEAEKLVREKNR